jgi:hypothetical protein
MITILWYLMALGLRSAYVFAKLTACLVVNGSRRRVPDQARGRSLELHIAQELDMPR